MRLFDSHSHIYDSAFAGDLAASIERARAAGVKHIAVCGDDLASSEAALRLAERFECIVPTAGFHPHAARDVTPAMLAGLEALARDPRVAAIGEVGLDHYRNLSPPEAQRHVLDAQLGIAVRLGKPVCVHSRNAEDAIEAPLRDYAAASPLRPDGRPVGVMHCFGGTLEQARRFVHLGFLISLACVVTYPRNDEARRIAASLPLETLVIETDSPYLPPQQLRGHRNEPAYVAFAARAIAEARGVSVETVAEETTRNAARLFGLRIPAEALT
ncbi:MAG: TatD family hydrolase [Dehalococcoidia bacterium]